MQRSKIVAIFSVLVLALGIVLVVAFADSCHEGNDPQQLETLEEQVEADGDGG